LFLRSSARGRKPILARAMKTWYAPMIAVLLANTSSSEPETAT
jgi:hypothetical protein